MPYRKIDTRMWRDERFRALSDDARLVWVLLLTGPQTTNVPGLYCAGMGQLAEEIGWSTDRFAAAFTECEARGMVHYDPTSRVIWLPNAIRYDTPRNGNQIRGWKTHLRSLPTSRLLSDAIEAMHRHILSINPAIANASGLFPKQTEVVAETNSVCLATNAVPVHICSLSRSSSSLQKKTQKRSQTLPPERAAVLGPVVEALRASLAAWRPQCRELRATPEQCARVWGPDLDRLERIDGVPVPRMLALLQWLATDPGDRADFWRANIRSGQKLRKHWDRLEHDSKSKEDRAVEAFVKRVRMEGARP